MERQTRVTVFESDSAAEVQLMKSKLENVEINTFTENGYMTFTTTPTATVLKLQVNLEDEPKAFDIIDAYLQENNLETKN